MALLVATVVTIRSGTRRIQQSFNSQRLIQGLKAQLQESREGFEKQIQQLKETNAQLAQELERSREKKSSPGETSQFIAQQQDIKELKEALKSKEGEVRQLTQAREEFHRVESRLQVRMNDQEKKQQQRQAEKENLERELANARTSLQKSDRQFARERQDYKRQVESLKRSLASVEASQRKLERQIEAERVDRKEYERLRRELAESNERIAELIVALDQQEKFSAQLAAGQVSSEGP